MSRADPERQREFAIEVVQRLRVAGFEAWWAGGCVRDSLLKRTPKDYDVATNARPDQVRRLFGTRRTLAIGAAFGVIAVLGPPSAGQIEVTTFRSDEGYSDARHPDRVRFGTAEADAQRRDFTINGMFLDPLGPDGGRVIDYVGGLADLGNRLVRAIGDARARFTEDRLRLLRAIRFAATFDFNLEEQTWQAIRQLADGVTTVSAERIAQEMRLMLVHPNRCRALELLCQSGLFHAILPEAPAPSDCSADRNWRLTVDTLHRLRWPGSDPVPFTLAMAALLDGLLAGGQPTDLQPPLAARVESICRRWKLSNQELRLISWLVIHAAAPGHAQDMPWPRLQRLLISDGAHQLLALAHARAEAAGADTSQVDYCRRMLALPPRELNPPPLVTGDDLVDHGLAPGKAFANLLQRIRDAQLECTISTKAEAIQLADRLMQDPDLGR